MIVSDKIILGLDPGTTTMGYGIIRIRKNKMEMISTGVIHLHKLENHELKLKKKFEKLNTLIIGISRDSIKKHKKFAEKHNLSILLASDESGLVTERFGVWVEKSMYGKKYMGIERSTFLFDEKLKLIKVWEKVKVKNHADEVYNFILESS